MARIKKSRLVYDELPEPYYGDPKKAKCVLIQFNPGKSDLTTVANGSLSNEQTKSFSCRENKQAFLIRSFLGIDENLPNCEKSYRKYAERWSSLASKYPNGISPERVCGHDWWWKCNRTRWIGSFTGADLKDVFVMETCPYHSLSWNGGGLPPDYLLQRIVIPAAMSAKENKIACVVSASSAVRDLLENLGARKIAEWKNVKGAKWASVTVSGKEYVVSNWQKNKAGNAAEHIYSLYEYRNPDFDCTCCFLYVKTSQMNYPSAAMQNVEHGIKKFIENYVTGERVSEIVRKLQADGYLGPESQGGDIGKCIDAATCQERTETKRTKIEVLERGLTSHNNGGKKMTVKELKMVIGDRFRFGDDNLEFENETDEYLAHVDKSLGRGNKIVYQVQPMQGGVRVRLYVGSGLRGRLDELWGKDKFGDTYDGKEPGIEKMVSYDNSEKIQQGIKICLDEFYKRFGKKL